MKVFNFYAYLKNKFPSINFVCGQIPPTKYDDYILIIDNGGQVSNHISRTDYSFQLLSFYNEATKARKAVETVFSGITRTFRIELPAITIDNVALSKCIAWQILAIQAPTYIGTDDNGRHMVSCNFIVTI